MHTYVGKCQITFALCLFLSSLSFAAQEDAVYDRVKKQQEAVVRAKRTYMALNEEDAASVRTPVAMVVSLGGRATITDAQGNARPATLKAPIYEGDTIETAYRSSVQIDFADRSKISLQGSSKFSLKEYNFGKGKEPSLEGEMTNGAMIFMAGQMAKIAPQNFKIQTGNATIGIQGSVGQLTTSDGTLPGTEREMAVMLVGGKAVTAVFNKTLPAPPGSSALFIVPNDNAIAQNSLDDSKLIAQQTPDENAPVPLDSFATSTPPAPNELVFALPGGGGTLTEAGEMVSVTSFPVTPVADFAENKEKGMILGRAEQAKVEQGSQLDAPQAGPTQQGFTQEPNQGPPQGQQSFAAQDQPMSPSQTRMDMQSGDMQVGEMPPTQPPVFGAAAMYIDIDPSKLEKIDSMISSGYSPSMAMAAVDIQSGKFGQGSTLAVFNPEVAQQMMTTMPIPGQAPISGQALSPSQAFSPSQTFAPDQMPMAGGAPMAGAYAPPPVDFGKDMPFTAFTVDSFAAPLTPFVQNGPVFTANPSTMGYDPFQGQVFYNPYALNTASFLPPPSLFAGVTQKINETNAMQTLSNVISGSSGVTKSVSGSFVKGGASGIFKFGSVSGTQSFNSSNTTGPNARLTLTFTDQNAGTFSFNQDYTQSSGSMTSYTGLSGFKSPIANAGSTYNAADGIKRHHVQQDNLNEFFLATEYEGTASSSGQISLEYVGTYSAPELYSKITSLSGWKQYSSNPYDTNAQTFDASKVTSLMVQQLADGTKAIVNPAYNSEFFVNFQSGLIFGATFANHFNGYDSTYFNSYTKNSYYIDPDLVNPMTQLTFDTDFKAWQLDYSKMVDTLGAQASGGVADKPAMVLRTQLPFSLFVGSVGNTSTNAGTISSVKMYQNLGYMPNKQVVYKVANTDSLTESFAFNTTTAYGFSGSGHIYGSQAQGLGLSATQGSGAAATGSFTTGAFLQTAPVQSLSGGSLTSTTGTYTGFGRGFSANSITSGGVVGAIATAELSGLTFSANFTTNAISSLSGTLSEAGSALGTFSGGQSFAYDRQTGGALLSSGVSNFVGDASFMTLMNLPQHKTTSFFSTTPSYAYPEGVMWGTWNAVIDATPSDTTQGKVFPGMHNFWVAGIAPTFVSGSTAAARLGLSGSERYMNFKGAAMSTYTGVSGAPKIETMAGMFHGSVDFASGKETFEGLIFDSDLNVTYMIGGLTNPSGNTVGASGKLTLINPMKTVKASSGSKALMSTSMSGGLPAVSANLNSDDTMLSSFSMSFANSGSTTATNASSMMVGFERGYRATSTDIQRMAGVAVAGRSSSIPTGTFTSQSLRGYGAGLVVNSASSISLINVGMDFLFSVSDNSGTNRGARQISTSASTDKVFFRNGTVLEFSAETSSTDAINTFISKDAFLMNIKTAYAYSLGSVATSWVSDSSNSWMIGMPGLEDFEKIGWGIWVLKDGTASSTKRAVGYFGFGEQTNHQIPNFSAMLNNGVTKVTYSGRVMGTVFNNANTSGDFRTGSGNMEVDLNNLNNTSGAFHLEDTHVNFTSSSLSNTTGVISGGNFSINGTSGSGHLNGRLFGTEAAGGFDAQATLQTSGASDPTSVTGAFGMGITSQAPANVPTQTAAP